MRVVHVNLAKGFGGGERQTALLIQALLSYPNINQILVCRKDSPLRDMLKSQENFHFAKADNQLEGHFSFGRIDVVHAHDAKALHWAYLHYLFKKVPYVVTRRMDKPVKDKLSNRLCFQHASARVAISTPIKNKLEIKGWGKVEIIADAFSKHIPSPEVTQIFKEDFHDKFLVGHAGSLVDRTKGQRVLLAAAKLLEKELPSMHFVFLGDGSDKELLHKESAGLSNVTWLGFKENIGDYLAAFDIFAFPSRNEGLGSVILEAMYIGVPVIASDAGGIPDIVIHEKTGLLFSSGNVLQLTDRLKTLYSSEKLRKKLKAEAYTQVKDYAPELMAKKYFDIYQKTIQLLPR